GSTGPTTSALRSAKFMLASITPGTWRNAPSIRRTQAAQVAPVMARFTRGTSAAGTFAGVASEPTGSLVSAGPAAGASPTAGAGLGGTLGATDASNSAP